MNSVTFGNKNSYKDWGLILKTKTIGLPDPKTEEVDVNGMDGVLDLTEAVTGTVRYRNRTLSFTFTIIDEGRAFQQIQSMISNHLHGKKMQVIISDDRSFYYIGRCKVNPFASSKKTAEITIDVDAEPYKLEVSGTQAGDKWLWDPFSFVDGVIRDNVFTISGQTPISLINRSLMVSPTFVTDTAMTVTYDGKTYNLPAGETTVYDILLPEGETSMVITGTGTVTVKYQGGSL